MNTPTDDDTHKEIVEIKSELKEVRQTQDAGVHLERSRWESHIERVIDNNEKLANLLLLVDGTKSGKRLSSDSGIHYVTCWRMLGKLEREGIIMRLERTENGSPIYKVARWFKILRLDDYLRKKFPQLDAKKDTIAAEHPTDQVDNNGINNSNASENQST
ncbi:MAG: hypothetical protein ACREBU_01870 [Nitrososphaera sp.]